jgi:hypothetical protein
MNGFIVGLIFITPPALWMMGPIAQDLVTNERDFQSPPRRTPSPAQEPRIHNGRINGILYFDAPAERMKGRVLR